MGQMHSDLKPPVREVILGKNSKVWQLLSADKSLSCYFGVAIGHAEAQEFEFKPNDRVWVFSYSRSSQQNIQLLTLLANAGVREIIYISSASTIVTQFTNCYEYPRVKHLAEMAACQLPNSRILVIGLVYEEPETLPGGVNVATSLAMLERFLLSPQWPSDSPYRMNLFEFVARPFANRIEFYSYRAYGSVQWSIRHWPCALRPIDFILRAMGIRWYGYLHFSNRLWSMMMS